MTAGLAVTALGGCLVASGTLDPVLTDAITYAESLTSHDKAPTKPDGTAIKTAKVADWQYFDNQPEWSSLRGIPQATRPAPPTTPERPAVAPPENPIHFHFSAPPPMRRYSLKVMTSCPQPHGQGFNAELLTAVSVVAGSAKVTWWDLGDPDTVSYQIAVVPVGTTGSNPVGYPIQGAGTPITYVNVPAPKTCKNVAVTIPGLKSGGAYRFFLLAMNHSPEQNGRAYRPSRGETETITIL